MEPSEARFLAHLVGVNFRGGDVKSYVRNELAVGDTLTLERDPYNQYDANAVKVLTHDGLWLGFIEATVAADVAPLLDGPWNVFRVEILAFNGEIKPHLEITLVEDAPDGSA